MKIILYFNEGHGAYHPNGLTSLILFRHISANDFLYEFELEPFRMLAEAHGWQIEFSNK